MTETAMASINEFNISVTDIHADTTSTSVLVFLGYFPTAPLIL